MITKQQQIKMIILVLAVMLGFSKSLKRAWAVDDVPLNYNIDDIGYQATVVSDELRRPAKNGIEF